MTKIMVKEYQTSEYNSLHTWVKKQLGKASSCSNSNCSGTCKQFGWALKSGTSYARDISLFESLCASCHSKRRDCSSKSVEVDEKDQMAQSIIRLYPSTYKKISMVAKKRRTSIAQVIEEKFSTLK